MHALTLTPPLTRRDWAALALILLIAAFMRLSCPGIVEMQHDEGMLSVMVQDMVYRGHIPLTGILSSTGIPNPPVTVYVLALPYALSNNPYFVTLWIAALNVVGVGLLWALARRTLGRLIAFAGALAYALNPWAILYSRKIWAQDFHTPFVLLALLLGVLGFLEGKRWAQALCLPVLLWGLQIHFAAWALLPLYGWLLWIGRRRLSWRALTVTVLLSGLVLAPFAMGLHDTLEDDPDRIRNGLDNSEDGGLSISQTALRDVARQATGYRLETWVAPHQAEDVRRAVPPSPLWFGIGGLVLAGLVGIWRCSDPRLAALVVAWATLPLLVFTPTWTDVYPHYFIAGIPALCLLAGTGITWLVRLLPGWPLRAAGLAVFATLLLGQGAWWSGLLRYLDTTFTPDGFGPSIHALMDIRDDLQTTDDVIVISDGFWIDLDREPAIWAALLYDNNRCVRTLTGDGFAVFPAGPFAVLEAPNAPEIAVQSLYETPNPRVYPLRPGEGAYTLHSFESAPDWFGPPLTPIRPALFANGVQIIGYRLEAGLLILEWTLPQPDPDADYQYFGHFLNAAGDKIGAADTSFWPGRFWCAGDRLVSWISITRPEDVTTLRVGMYALLPGGGYRNSDIVDADGQPVSPWIDIPLPAE